MPPFRAACAATTLLAWLSLLSVASCQESPSELPATPTCSPTGTPSSSPTATGTPTSTPSPTWSPPPSDGNFTAFSITWPAGSVYTLAEIEVPEGTTLDVGAGSVISVLGSVIVRGYLYISGGSRLSAGSLAVHSRAFARFGSEATATNISVRGTVWVAGYVEFRGALSISATDVLVLDGAGMAGNGYGRRACSPATLPEPSVGTWPDITRPSLPRSVGYCPALMHGEPGSGASLELNASGTLTINGTVDSNGGDGYNGYCNWRCYTESPPGPGGSVLLMADTLGPSTGQLTVRGGSAPNSAAAGGRIAVHCRQHFFSGNGSWPSWTLGMNAPPGRALGYNAGLAGTIYVNCGTYSRRLRIVGEALPVDSSTNRYYALSTGPWLYLPRQSATRLFELSVVDARMPSITVEGGASVAVLQLDAVTADITLSRVNPTANLAQPMTLDIFATEFALLQRAGTPLYTPSYFSPAVGHALVGTLLASVSLANEVRCGLACCEAAPACSGYTLTATPVTVGVDDEWNGMGTGGATAPTANCFLYANVTALLPNLLVRSGVARSVLPGLGGTS